MNLATHVSDDPDAVARNRQILREKLHLDHDPAWLEQVHSTQIIDLDHTMATTPADGSTTTRNGQPCVVLTADCLPVLLTDSNGMRVAALHAGWRGLAGGILEHGASLFSPGQEILAWMGPAIGAEQFEVGEEVIEQLAVSGIDDSAWCSQTTSPGKWLVDIYQLARLRLHRTGVAEVSGGAYCTFTEDRRFYSYRRQVECGRMATLIWIDHQAAS
jgi:YfiH family protein